MARLPGFFHMPGLKQKLRFAAGFSALLTLALAAGCRGFFVNPTLQSIAVSPTTGSVAPAGTIQMTATGTFDDGSTSNVTSKSTWQSSDTTVATVGPNNGLVKAATTIASPPGVTTITATDGAFTEHRHGYGMSGRDQHHGHTVYHQSGGRRGDNLYRQRGFFRKCEPAGCNQRRDLDDFEYASNPVNFCRRSDGEFNSFGPDYNRYRKSVRRHQPGGYNYGSVISSSGTAIYFP